MAEELARIRELNRLRQQRFYNKNKDAVNAKRRANTQQLNECKAKEDVPPPEPPAAEPVLQAANIVLPEKIDIADVNALLDQLHANNVIKTVGSLKTYKDGIKRLMRLINCDDLITCLADPVEIRDAIDNSAFAINTRKGMLQAVVFLIDNLKLPYTKHVFDEYKRLFGVNKLKSQTESKEKTKEKVITFSEYFEKVKEHFGENSKMGLLIGCYGAFTGRDVFQLKITDSRDEADKDKKRNYLLLTAKKFTLVINTYKTEKKYGQYNVKLSKHLTKLLHRYILANQLTLGDYLFGKNKLSSFISSQNKLIGIKGGIDLIRHMMVTEEFEKAKAEGRNLTEEERLDLANKMQHSPAAQLLYLRNQE